MIRYFTLEDIGYIYELGNKITPKFSKTNDLNDIYNDKYTKILVYEENQKIIGFLMYTELEETCDILDIIVAEEHRNKKVASCLIDYMITGLSETVKLMTLEVRKSNIPALNLYDKFGFEIINTRIKYYDDEDAYLMGRRFEK